MSENIVGRKARKLPTRDLYVEAMEAAKRGLEVPCKEDEKAPQPRALRTPTLPPPPPRFEKTTAYLRGRALPGSPSLTHAESSSDIEIIPTLQISEDVNDSTSPAEISGSHSIPPDERRHAVDTAKTIEQIHARIDQLHQGQYEVAKQVADLTSAVRTVTKKRSYAPLQSQFQEPPSRISWLGEMVKNAASAVKSVWGRIRGTTPPSEIKKATPDISSTWRLLEQVEQNARDLPTMFLTGKSMDGKTLDRRTLAPTAKALESRAEVLTKSPRTTNIALEKRRNAITDKRIKSIQNLVKSVEVDFDPVDTEEGADFLIAAANIKERIHTVAKTAEDNTEIPSKQKAAQAIMEKLGKITGTISTTQKINRITLTCEAALKLPYAQIDNASREYLSKEYLHRLQEIKEVIELKGKGKEAIESLQNMLARDVETETVGASRQAA